VIRTSVPDLCQVWYKTWVKTSFPTSEPTLSPWSLPLTSLKGVRTTGVKAGIKASGQPDLGLLVCDHAVPCAGVFTQNQFAAAPVHVSRNHLRESKGWMRAIVINSGNANACTGEQGEHDALQMCAQVASALDCPIEQVLVCSTGVIGVPLPFERVKHGIQLALDSLESSPDSAADFVRAIMTTDAFPKTACHNMPGHWLISGVAKGAGMIHPNMATMLAVMGCSVHVPHEQLQALTHKLARHSFNAIHVDTHPSTNDTFFVFSSGEREVTSEQWEGFSGDMQRVARRLSWLIVRDGEGASKVTTIRVHGAQTNEDAEEIARLLASSALVRTALFGDDPNWGRFVSQVGNSKALRFPELVRCSIQGVCVFEHKSPLYFDRKALSQAMHQDDVLLDIEIGLGPGTFELLTSDLSYRYIEVNAEYTT
jgi:glutamate N-acetyltransferase / amino-acid N-acetyltransferase